MLLDGVSASEKRATVITFLELRIQKKSERSKIGPEFGPVFREKLKVPPRPFPLEEQSHYNHSGQLQVFFTQLEPNSHGVRQSSHVSVETNSNKRISVLGTNHTKIYRVNLVGFKHSAEDPSRSPHHQNKYTLRSKRFSNVLSKHQGRFPETVPEAKHSQTEVPITSD